MGFLLPSSSWLLKLPSLAPREELIVFAYLLWKPQFFSVVQFPFDHCHSPFSPTTFFEIGVYNSVSNLLQIHYVSILHTYNTATMAKLCQTFCFNGAGPLQYNSSVIKSTLKSTEMKTNALVSIANTFF